MTRRTRKWYQMYRNIYSKFGGNVVSKPMNKEKDIKTFEQMYQIDS